ncbi:hypothetical protein M422DRAFT_248570 [Sphaerobolus stellatus SS14]|nr:hypothetical protein M422DRAFT_248570 [Sphaerobolus stellatus SS14]
MLPFISFRNIVLSHCLQWRAISPSKFVWIVFFDPAGPLYVNSFLVSLNAREGMRRQLRPANTTTGSTNISMFDIDGDEITTVVQDEVEMRALAQRR